MPELYSGRIDNTRKSEIRELVKLAGRPGIVSLAAGMPDPGTFPASDILEASIRVLDTSPSIALQYGPTGGEPELIDILCSLIEEDGIEVGPENVIITVSSQQAIELLSRVFLDPGDAVVVGLPTFLGAIASFTSAEAQLVGIPLDDSGLRTDLIEEALDDLEKRGIRTKMIYVIPDFQNPSGITLSAGRRKELLDMTKRRNLALVEDNPYRRFRYVGQNLPALFRDWREHPALIHVGTFSKILFPGMRLGWVMARREIIEKLELATQAADLCAPSVTQYIIKEYLSTGKLSEHLDSIRSFYSSKREAMLGSLERHLKGIEGVRWSRPEGGFFVWLELPKQVNTADMLPEAIEKGVAYVPGASFFADRSGTNTMRLNFSLPTEDGIEEGVRRLAEVIIRKLDCVAFYAEKG
jgi:2-aminoadipate transaminase